MLARSGPAPGARTDDLKGSRRITLEPAAILADVVKVNTSRRPEEMKDLIREYVAAFNRGDVEAVCRCFAPDAIVFGVLGWGDLAKARPIWEQLVTCFQMKLRIESMVAEEDAVAVRYTERGKFVAPFRGFAPTGKSYEVVAMEWFVVGEIGIIRRWGARDAAAIFRQMGIPPP